MTSESLSGWLALRETADTRARSAALTQAVVEHLTQQRPLRVLDLGAGTGANIRYLSSRLPQAREWLAVDKDPLLLAQVPSHAETRCQDLGPLDDPSLFSGRHLVTASALLDLVSEEWLERIARRCRASGAAVLFVLTYDGRFTCAPPEAEDESVREWVNAHQRKNDKGFGRAAGPDAVRAASEAFERAGYEVRRERSDWDLAPDEEAMQRELLTGWAEAASELAGDKSRVIRNWLARRLAHVDEGRSRIRVGHEDIAGWLR